MALELDEVVKLYKPSGRLYNGRHRVLFGIDSDGCVDLGMRKKHTNPGPFALAGIEIFGLQAIEHCWRIAWTYLNEFKDRGCPRFAALAQTVDYALQMPEVQAQEELRNVEVPRFSRLKRYVENILKTKGAGDNVLEEYLESIQGDGAKRNEWIELSRVKGWSKRVNKLVDELCPYIPPFPEAVEAIKQAHSKGIDIMIVSGTPEAHLRRQWEDHGLSKMVQGVYGRDTANKSILLQAAVMKAQQQGHPYDKVIMFGDAPGDFYAKEKAARASGKEMNFFPIRAGHEEEGWKNFSVFFLGEGMDVMGYGADYEGPHVEKFFANLDIPFDPNADISQLFAQGA
jgi:phosphoglycolate phosphatase-like HAD superfamily hydrolase